MKSERQEPVHLFRILDLLKEGVRSDQIPAMIYEEGRERGLRAEKIAEEAIAKLPIIKAVKKSTNEEDYFLEVDFFVYFINGVKHTMVGLRVKSSQKALEKFMKRVQPGQRIIGVYAKAESTHHEVQQQFLEQLIALDGEI